MPDSNSHKREKRPKTFATLFSPSTRLTLTYIVLFVWIALAVFAIIIKADLYALAVYFTSGLPVILGYLWAQTARPDMKDAAEIVKGINQRPGNNQQYGNNYGGVGNVISGYANSYSSYSGVDPSQIQQTQYNTQSIQTQTNEPTIISIYADDTSAELKISQSQLGTLTNIGYVNNVDGKYIFKGSLLEQIKSLISGTPDPSF